MESTAELQATRDRIGVWIENVQAKKGDKCYSIARQFAKLELNVIDEKIKKSKKVQRK